MRASADSPRLRVRERISSGPTGALSVLFEAEGASVSGAHVAYPSGDAVVVAETRGGLPTTFSRVTFAGDGDEASSPLDPPSLVAWEPGETRGALLVARGRDVHLCAPAETFGPETSSSAKRDAAAADAADAAGDTRAGASPSPRREARAHAWESLGRVRCAAKVVAAAWTDDGAAFVAASADGEIRAWRVVAAGDGEDETDEDEDASSFVRDDGTAQSRSRRRASALATAWRVVADATRSAPHETLAAGASASALAASAARDSRDACLWDPRGFLAQILRHPTAVTSARWRRSERERDGARTRASQRWNDVALVTTSEDGAARVWTAAPTALGGATDRPSLVQTVVVQTDPGPSGYGPALLEARWLAWRPEPRGVRRRERDESAAAPPLETPTKDVSRKRDEDAAEASARDFGFAAAAVPARDGADFLAALGSDGAVWVWMLEGFDATAAVPRAHLWRRAPIFEEDRDEGGRAASRARLRLAAASPSYFSATWVSTSGEYEGGDSKRASRESGGANSTGAESDRGLQRPRGDPPPLRVVIASPEAGARACELDLASRDANACSRVTLARAAALRGHADGDAVTLVRACDETGAVVSVDARGEVRVWRWRRDEKEKGGATAELAPVSFRTAPPCGVSAAAWYRGTLFLATTAGLLETHAFCDDDEWIVTGVGAVSTRTSVSGNPPSNHGTRPDADDTGDGEETITSLDACGVVLDDDAANQSAPAAALTATRQDGEVLSWALVANDGYHAPSSVRVPFAPSRASSCRPGTTPAVVVAGPPARASAFSTAWVNADGDVSLAVCEAEAEVEVAEGASRSSFALRWTNAGFLRRDAREGETPTALVASPSGAAVALALLDGRIEVWEAESDAHGAFTLATEFRVGSAPCQADAAPTAGASSCHLSWFDLGGGAEALAIARGARIEVRVARRGAWRVLAAADLSRLFAREPGASGVGGLAWSARGDALVVGAGHELAALAPSSGASLARAIAEAAAALPEYHPRVLMDWLVRGETRRARAAARRVSARLREETSEEADLRRGASAAAPPGAAGASVARLLEESVAVSGDAAPKPGSTASGLDANANANANAGGLVPEFDAGAFGGFAGFGGATRAPAPARFRFGADTRDDDDALSALSANESETALARSPASAAPHDASARFSTSEAEEVASLIARPGAEARLPGLTGTDRVGLLATLDALRNADGGADAADDEAGRRFRALRRARTLRDARLSLHRGAPVLDAHGPRGEELAWALHSDAEEALLTSFGFSRFSGRSSASTFGDASSDGGKCEWRALRLAGAPLWVRDDETLRKLVDAAARHAFATSRDPGGENPCALLFAALGRASTLAGVFRAARDSRLADFFSRDFSERKNKEAALKNAYALLSKHRYLFASAFFVLAGQPQDAAALVWKHVGDLSLAVAVARLAKGADDIAVQREGRSHAVRDELEAGGTKRGGEASDDGTLSASAFAGFDFAAVVPPSAERVSARRAAESAETTRDDDDKAAAAAAAADDDDVCGARSKAEAPLPASLSPAAKAFVKARVVPDFEARAEHTDDARDAVEGAWTLAALRWLCGDGDASVESFRRLVRDASETSLEDAVSAADLCAFVSGRRALREAAPSLARAAAAAAAAAAGRLALALEAEGMPLAALEREAGRKGVHEGANKGASDERSADGFGAEGSRFGALTASAATRARTGVVSRLAAAALAPEMSRGSSPEASLEALVRVAPGAFAGGAEAATRASLARRDASSAFAAAFAPSPSLEPEPDPSDAARPLEPANAPAAALDAHHPTAFDPDAPQSRRPPSVDLDPESAKRAAAALADAPATPQTTKKASGLKRLRDRLSVKIRGGASSGSPGASGGDDARGASPLSGERVIGFGVSSPPDTPASPTSPAASASPPSGFDVLMPGFGVSVLAETLPRAVGASGAASGAGSEISGVSSRRHAHRRWLRRPLDIARLQGDAFYGVCVNPATPHQIGLACVKKGLVIADLRALGAAGAPRAPDGREPVVDAADALRVASAAPTLVRLWADPRDGRCEAGGPDGVAPWPRGAWRRPKRAARKEMPGAGSRAVDSASVSAAADPTRIDWTAAANSVAAAAAGVAANAAAAMGALDATDAPAGAGGGVPGDVVARCAEAHPREPVLLAGDAFGSVSIWRFAVEGGGAESVASARAFVGAVRLPTARSVRASGGGGEELASVAGRAAREASAAAFSSRAARLERAARGTSSTPADVARRLRGGELASAGVSTPEHAGGVAVSSASWGPGGARFAAGGSDGAVAVWRSDQFLDPAVAPASFRPPPRPGKSRVEAIAFASAAVVAAVGSHLAGARRDDASAAGASLVLWDTLRAPDAPPAAAVAAHEGGATALCWLPGGAVGASPWPLLATAGRDGEIAAHDLRKLSDAIGAQTSVVWRARRLDAGVGHAAAVKALAAVAPAAGARGGSGERFGAALVSGCKDGDVRVWSCASGAHVQHLPAAHERHTFLAPRGGGGNVLQGGVSKLVPLEGGVLSCGGDGMVKLFRLAPEAFEADRGASF